MAISPLGARRHRGHSQWLRLILVLAALGWPGTTAPAVAQVAEGSLAGLVVDPDGGPLAGARALVRSDAAGMRRSTTTDAGGRFVFPSLPAGEWKAEASLHGYTVALVGEVWVHVAQTRRLRLVLEPSEFEEMVTQSDYRPLARTGADLGAWVTPAEVSNLPLATRTLGDLASLVPLPTAAAPRIRLDGGMVAAGAVPAGAVEEAALLSHSYGAEFGGIGGVVSLVTRGGDAHYRASAFAFFTDDSPESRGSERWQLGASFGSGLDTAVGDVRLFGAYESHDLSPGLEDRDWLTALATWQDASHVARLRYAGADVSGLGRTDDVLAGLQSQPLDGILNDFRIQWSSGDRVAIRDDLFLTGPADGRHEITAGAESLAAGDDSVWALYARDRWLLHERVTATAALRSQHADHGGSTDENLSPRMALVWSLGDDGTHLLRGAAGRYRPLPWDATSQAALDASADHLSLGWSWQMSPFLGVNVEAVSVDYSVDYGDGGTGDAWPSDYDAVGLTVRSRISDVFQVRAAVSWLDDAESVGASDGERAVLTGIVHAPADVLLAAVYRHGTRHTIVLAPDPADAPDRGGLDLRLSKLLPFGDQASVEIMAEVFDVFEESEGEAERIGQLGLRVRF